MGNAITQDVRAMWLTLRGTGSWWTIKALTSHWAPTYAQFEVQDALEALRAGGFAERRSHDLCDPAYCITSSCKALPDIQPTRQPGAIV